MRRIPYGLLVIFVVLVFVTAGVFFYSPAHFWAQLAGPAVVRTIDFAKLVKTEKPNQYLMCPPTICRFAVADDPSILYPVPVEMLKKHFLAIVKADRAEIVDEGAASLKLIVRTPYLAFPDLVNVEFFAQENGSTMAIYSRAQIGYSDFGVNRKRVKRWLLALDPLVTRS